jgi:hypothetical protein
MFISYYLASIRLVSISSLLDWQLLSFAVLQAPGQQHVQAVSRLTWLDFHP